MFKRIRLFFVFFTLSIGAYADKINIQENENKQKLIDNAVLFIELIEDVTFSNEGGPNSSDDILSDDFVREVRPSDLNIPNINWPQYEAFTRRVGRTLFDTFSVQINRTSIDTSTNRVFMEATPDSDIKYIAGGGKYKQEYLLIFEFDKDYKIKKVIEYVDSLNTACFFQLPNCPLAALPPASTSAKNAISSEWNNGYCATITISNVIDDTLRNWDTSAMLNGATIDNVWNAEFVTIGDITTFTPPAWFTTLTPNDAFELGYCATKADNQTNWQPSLTSN